MNYLTGSVQRRGVTLKELRREVPWWDWEARRQGMGWEYLGTLREGEYAGERVLVFGRASSYVPHTLWFIALPTGEITNWYIWKMAEKASREREQGN